MARRSLYRVGTSEDLKQANIDIGSMKFLHPEQKVERLESIYHLVYMIYLDEKVDDIELEVASIFAQTLGFRPSVVSDLFKAIATQDTDNSEPRNVREEVIDFLALHEV